MVQKLRDWGGNPPPAYGSAKTVLKDHKLVDPRLTYNYSQPYNHVLEVGG